MSTILPDRFSDFRNVSPVPRGQTGLSEKNERKSSEERRFRTCKHHTSTRRFFICGLSFYRFYAMFFVKISLICYLRSSSLNISSSFLGILLHRHFFKTASFEAFFFDLPRSSLEFITFVYAGITPYKARARFFA